MKLPLHKVLITEEQIKRRIKELAKQVSEDLADENPVFLVVLRGAFIFAADLLKELNFPYEIAFISASSYADATEPVKNVSLKPCHDIDISGRTVVIVEDIVDTGGTIKALYEFLKKRNAKRIEVVTLLSKKARRKHDLKIKYVGFEVPNVFVFGYGLDWKQNFRGIRDIMALETNDEV